DGARGDYCAPYAIGRALARRKAPHAKRARPHSCERLTVGQGPPYVLGVYTTRARRRSWMLRAPTARLSPSTTIRALILWASISRAASMASLSAAMVLGWRVITSSTEVSR